MSKGKPNRSPTEYKSRLRRLAESGRRGLELIAARLADGRVQRVDLSEPGYTKRSYLLEVGPSAYNDLPPIARDLERLRELLQGLLRDHEGAKLEVVDATRRELGPWIKLAEKPNVRHELASRRGVLLDPADLAGKIEGAVNEVEGWLGKQSRLVRVVDTSAFMNQPDPRSYGAGSFDFVLPLVVLREIDNLKQSEIAKKRELARRAHRMVTGWARQGDLTLGVVVDKTVRVQCLPENPSPLPEGLGAEKPDDLVLATAARLDRQRLWAAVVLCSADSNQLVRAQGLGLQVEKGPDSDGGSAQGAGLGSDGDP